MIDRILSIVAPHHCYNCQKTGPVLCDSCKYDIVEEDIRVCIVCGRVDPSGICSSCKTFYEKAWQIGEREGLLSRLVDDYKFERVKSFGSIAADMLDQRIDQLPASTIVVPVPTISAHIRQRGYDHTALVAKAFAQARSLSYSPVLVRKEMSHQRGAGRNARFQRASKAFRVNGKLDASTPYLIIDDVLTTGATLQFAAKALRETGAEHVWVAIIARQPIDKRP